MTPTPVLFIVIAIGAAMPQVAKTFEYQSCAPLLVRPMAEQEGPVVVMNGPQSHVKTVGPLVDDSKVIVVGRVVSQVCRVDTSPVPAVYSRYSVAVESSLLGSSPGAVISVLVRGTGRIANFDGRSLQTQLEGFEPPKVGDRLLLFLKPDQVESDSFAISEWGEGIFFLTVDGMVRSPWRQLIGRGVEYLHAQVEGHNSAAFVDDVVRAIKR